MMVIVVIIVAVAILIMGFKLMDQIDHFVDENNRLHLGQNYSPLNRNTNQIDDLQQYNVVKKGIMIYGSTTYVECARKEKIQYEELKGLEISEKSNYSSAFIVSESDANNMILCNKMHRMDPDVYIVVRCNDPCYKKLYKELGANYILAFDELSGELIKQIWKSVVRYDQ